MRRVLLLVVVLLSLVTPQHARAGTMPDPLTVLDRTFSLNPNDESRTVAECFDVPYGALLTVVVWNFEDDVNGESVTFSFREGPLTRFRGSLTTNQTMVAGYAGAGTYCYSIVASHVHLDTVAPIRHSRLLISAETDMSRWGN